MTIVQQNRTRPLIMASMLTADMARLGEECRALERAGVDGIHWDIMDGVAVPSLSFGPAVVAACRRETGIPFEAHVMSRRPEIYVDDLAASGCRSVTIHPDWVPDPRRILQRIVDRGMIAGIALSPGTPVGYADWHLDLAGHVLVMTVEPGFGGQNYIPAMARKVEAVRQLARTLDREIMIEADGGIGPETLPAVVLAGADSCVVGSALWRGGDYAAAVARLHAAVAPRSLSTNAGPKGPGRSS